jgi:hypothetical protein
MTVREQLEKIKQQKASPLPTPPVGTMVVWHDRNEDDRNYAAVVTFVEGVGRVKLAIFKPNAHVIHKEGVLHRTHEVHENKHSTVTMRNGAWDYVPGQTVPKSHRDLHLRDLEKREAALIQSEKELTAAAN